MTGRIVIAVPKGSLYDEACDRLRLAGLDVPETTGRLLKMSLPESDVDLLLLRPSDVPAYVESGAADCGIVGKDTLWESDHAVSELLDLHFGRCSLALAARRIDGFHLGRALPTFLRVATKFTRTASEYFARKDLACEIIGLHGSVELGPLVGLADVIVDLVSTGATLREHDMVVIDEIAASTARFIVNPIRFRAKYDRLMELLSRLEAGCAV